MSPRWRGRMPKTAKDKGDREDVLRANRTQTANLVPPIRQTASIFKQPVTVVKVHESKVKNDFKAAAGAEKPRQLFWEKRLNGMGAKSWLLTSLPWNYLGVSRDCKQLLGKREKLQPTFFWLPFPLLSTLAMAQ